MGRWAQASRRGVGVRTLGPPEAPGISGSPSNGAATSVTITPVSQPDPNGGIAVKWGGTRGVGGTTIDFRAVPASPYAVSLAGINGQHVWAVQGGGGTLYAGTSGLSVPDIISATP